MLGDPAAAAAAAKSLQSCPTLCDPIDGSPSGSSTLGILQARTLEWVAISFSNAWKWKVKVKSLSPVWLLATPWTVAYQAPLPMGFSRKRVLEWGAIAFSGSETLQICKFLEILLSTTLLFPNPKLLSSQVGRASVLDYSFPQSHFHLSLSELFLAFPQCQIVFIPMSRYFLTPSPFLYLPLLQFRPCLPVMYSCSSLLSGLFLLPVPSPLQFS